MWLIWVQETHRKRLYAKRHAFGLTKTMWICVCAMYGEEKIARIWKRASKQREHRTAHTMSRIGNSTAQQHTHEANINPLNGSRCCGCSV